MTDQDDYSLLVPFVVTASHGGPFTDDAYCAGFEMGGFLYRLAVAQSINAIPMSFTIRRDNLAQADLIAMHQGFTLVEDEMSDEIYDTAMIAEWANVTVNWPAQTFEGPPQ